MSERMDVMSFLAELAVPNRMRFRDRVRRLAVLIVVACLVPVVGSQSALRPWPAFPPGFLAGVGPLESARHLVRGRSRDGRRSLPRRGRR